MHKVGKVIARNEMTKQSQKNLMRLPRALWALAMTPPKTWQSFLITAFVGIILIALHWPTWGFPFRGEHWSLANLFVAPMDLSQRLLHIATFNCADIIRLQPLAFFIPYASFLALGDWFLGHQILCLFIHLASVFLVVKILEELECPLSARVLGAIFFGVSYNWADLLNWSFFIYIFFHGFYVLLAIWSLLKALKTGEKKYLTLHGLAVMLASFAYESGLVFFGLDLLFCGLLGANLGIFRS